MWALILKLLLVACCLSSRSFSGDISISSRLKLNRNWQNKEKIVGALPSTPPVTSAEANLAKGSDQQSLRDRILKQRDSQSQAASTPAASTPLAGDTLSSAAVKSEPATPDFNDVVVEPDFSHLGFAPTNETVSHPDLKPASENKLPQVARKPIADRAPKTVRRGRFTLNRPTADQLRVLDEPLSGRSTALEPSIERTSRRRIDRNQQAAGPTRTKARQLAADNPRYRMVPVRENIGRNSVKADDYVTYTTVFGDTLHGLSTKFFGTPDRYLDIYLANRKLFESPADVPINTVIRIPISK